MRILFASAHCVIDFSSGAAVATMDALRLLARLGLDCRAFCGSKVDAPDVSGQLSVVSGHDGGLVHVRNGVVPVTVFRTQSTRIDHWAPLEPEAMLGAFERVVADCRPDVLLTYGGDGVSLAMIELAKRRGVTVVFWLHNFGYDDARVFRRVDHVIVPSEFSRRTLGYDVAGNITTIARPDPDGAGPLTGSRKRG